MKKALIAVVLSFALFLGTTNVFAFTLDEVKKILDPYVGKTNLQEVKAALFSKFDKETQATTTSLVYVVDTANPNKCIMAKLKFNPGMKYEIVEGGCELTLSGSK